MKKQRTREERKKSSLDWFLRIVLCAFIITALVLIGRQIRSKYVFLKNTYINQVDCSGLTVKKAEQKIKSELFNTVVIHFDYGETKLIVPISDLKPTFCKEELTEDLKEIMRNQDSFKNLPSQEETISNLYTVDNSTVRNFLADRGIDSVSNFQAQIEWNSARGKYEIVDNPDNVGMSADQITDYAVNWINNGETSIDFRKLQKRLWSDRKEVLIVNLYQINETLANTNLQFVIANETIGHLDAETIKDWVQMNEEGTLYIKTEGNVEDFVNYIAQTVEGKKHPTFFKPSGLDRQIEIGGVSNYVIDKEKVSSWIKENLGKEQSIEITANSTPLKDYIELDITRQTVWLYRNGECIMTSPCVTGNIATGHGTRTGVFSIYEKTMNETLRGYENDGTPYTSHVERWMEFDNGNGFHDAKWRYGVFGGDIYKTNGSHGCVNMPTDKAKYLYDNIWLGFKVIVYKS